MLSFLAALAYLLAENLFSPHTYSYLLHWVKL